MKRSISVSIAAVVLLACSVSLAAQDTGLWRPADKTAESVTGEIAITESKLLMNFLSFEIVHARDLEPSEVSAVFDTDSNAAKKGRLYGLNIPASRKFLHKNTLCGSEDTHWMATYVDGRTLRVAFFSGARAPVFTIDAISNSIGLCGTYSYTP